MKNLDVIIVGSGLFGSVTAKYLASKGKKVLVLDSKEHLGASKCALGVWREGWEEKVKEKTAISIPILDDLYGVDEIPFFDFDSEKEIDLKWVDCRKILKKEPYKMKATVVEVENNKVFVGKERLEIKAKMVVLCAGVWVDKILSNSGYKILYVESHWGANMEVGLNIDCNRILTWAPYKQSVILKLDEENFLFSDGVKVKEPKANDLRVKKVSERCQLHLNQIVGSTISNDKITAVREGLRPFLPKGVDHFNKHDKQLFSATGGGKNSLILSGWIAHKVFEELSKI